MRVHLVQLEPLKERYTEWWATYIPEQLRSFGWNVNVIEGEALTSTVESGTVLDACGTNYYKASQMKQIAELFHNGEIKAGDRFLITDIWFPGIEAIRYMSDLMEIPVKIYGVWHAGSITDEDFMQPSNSWAKYFELGFLKICDAVFVGTEYSKESIGYRLLPYAEDASEFLSKIHAQGMPLDTKMLGQVSPPKKPIILFPHRFDIEKRPNIFMDAIEVLTQRHMPKSPIEFCFCTSRKDLRSNAQWLVDKVDFLSDRLAGTGYSLSIRTDLPKKSYYELLASSTCMVSTTIEENFGYCLAESLAVGTRPIVPNAFSHPEILDGRGEYLYNSFDELTTMIVKAIGLYEGGNELIEERLKLTNLVRKYADTVWSWHDIMTKT